MIWLHIISDLKEIDFWSLDLDEIKLRDFIDSSLKDVWLSKLWDFYHTFWNTNELTMVIALKESHISIHSWPEKSYVSLDIFVCNFWEDNSLKAKKLYKYILDFFNPAFIEEKLIERKS